MFDIGWSELFLIGVVALIVVGPKDLPKLFHALGQFTAKARSMAREFQSAMEEAARQAGVDEVAKDVKTLTSAKSLGLDALSSATKKLDAWDQTKRGASDRDKEAEEPAEVGPETAGLAAKRKAEAEAADARAAEIAALRDKPTPEELAEGATGPDTEPAEPAKPAAKKPRKPRAKSAGGAAKRTTGKTNDTAAASAEAPAKPARKPRGTAKASAKAPAMTAAKTATKSKTAAPRPNGADPTATAAKPARKRAAPRKSDA